MSIKYLRCLRKYSGRKDRACEHDEEFQQSVYLFHTGWGVWGLGLGRCLVVDNSGVTTEVKPGKLDRSYPEVLIRTHYWEH